MSSSPAAAGGMGVPTAAAGGRLLGDLRSLFGLAVPIVVGLICSALAGVVTSAVAAPLGPAALGAVSLTASVELVFVAALYGFLSPVGVLAAQAYGAADAVAVAAQRAAGWRLAATAGAGAVALMAASIALLPWAGQPANVLDVLAPYWLWTAASLLPLALLFAYKQLFDAIDRPWIAVTVMVASVAVHAVLSPWLVRGGAGLAPRGLAGAGIAGLLANLCGAVAMAWLARRMPGPRQWLHASEASWPAALRLQRTEGVPMGLQYLLETGANAVAGLFVGVFGAVALAANQVTMSVTMTLYMLPLGMAAAVGIRMAQAVGASDRGACWPLGKAALLAVTAWMTLASIGLALFGAEIARLFGADDAVVAVVALIGVAVGVMQVADGVQSVSLGALRGLLDSRWPTRVSLACYWGLALPSAWALSHTADLGPAGVWLGFGAGLLVAAVALTLRLRRLTRGVVAQPRPL
ncbi:MAG TPA: MATE family efflux transporter [Ideonella sp.]|uniref:MATE family efflux transporter n=1 Tax=Ideonella sp. TaxID=1929293 RepID=UPI002E3013CF|nr:MATE family efflux transporter [Ideonella sp.]HEX5685436.1 MATE family efflux transporter [Ideonella sp.]